MTHRAASLFLVALIGVTPVVAGGVVHLTPIKDTTIFENDPGASSGAGPALFIGTGSDGERRHALLQFDVTGAVPTNSLISSVTLTLTIESAAPGASENGRLRLHRMTKEWGEAGSDSGFDEGGAPAEPGDATWFHAFFPTVLWEGFYYEPFDYLQLNPPVSGTFEVSDIEMVYDVRDWILDPSTNQGWIFREFSAALRTFFSRESSAPPVLTIEYVDLVPEAGAVPDGAMVPGPPLRVNLDLSSGSKLDFEWGPGCRLGSDFALYSGTTGNFYDHSAVACTTSGQQSLEDVPFDLTEGRYFLVVPISDAGNEGSHGFDGDGNPRPRGSGASCPIPQQVAEPTCP